MTSTKEDMKAIVDQNRFAAHVRPKDMVALVEAPFMQIFAKGHSISNKQIDLMKQIIPTTKP